MATLAREFDACGECRLEVGGPDKYRRLSDDEIREVVTALEGRRELLKCASVLPGVIYMDPPDGGDVPISEQLRRMAQDAARYRWLRGGPDVPRHSTRWPRWEVRNWSGRYWETLFAEKMDAEIDAARASEVAHECETCCGNGTIDERLGGEWNSNPKAECPDCGGVGEVRIKRPNDPNSGAHGGFIAGRPLE